MGYHLGLQFFLTVVKTALGSPSPQNLLDLSVILHSFYSQGNGSSQCLPTSGNTKTPAGTQWLQRDSVLKTVHTDFLRPLTPVSEGTRTLMAHGFFILEVTAGTLLHSNYTLFGGSQSLTGDEVTVSKSLRLS